VTQHVPRDHGGGVDAAAARFGGVRADWIDLSTGINPVPYPIPDMPQEAWTALPDREAELGLIAAARAAWNVPDGAALLAAPGASALIARMPGLAPVGTVHIAAPTYNEHAAAFEAQGWKVTQTAAQAHAQVIVNPNNPDGRVWSGADLRGGPLTVIDESFCDVMPDASLIAHAARPGVVILKSFGKFWGLAGLRLGFAIGDPAMIRNLRDGLGPWPVSGPALRIGTAALCYPAWASAANARLRQDADRLDALMVEKGAVPIGGTRLFRLFDTQDAIAMQDRLARHRIWSRVFPYSPRWLRLGLPMGDGWDRLGRV